MERPLNLEKTLGSIEDWDWGYKESKPLKYRYMKWMEYGDAFI